MIRTTALAAVVVASASASAATIDTYDNLTDWQNAVGGNFSVEGFTYGPVTGVDAGGVRTFDLGAAGSTLITTYESRWLGGGSGAQNGSGAVIDDDGILDRVAFSPLLESSMNLSSAQRSFGLQFQLSGGDTLAVGIGILILADDQGNTQVLGQVDESNEFFGFVTDFDFTQILFQPGGNTGGASQNQDTFRISTVYASAVGIPTPAAAFTGVAGLGLVAARRRR